MSRTFYEFLQVRIRELTSIEWGFPGIIARRPVTLSRADWKGCQERYEIIRHFQRAALDLFFLSLDGAEDPRIATDFFRDLPPCFGVEFHRQLPRERIQLPMFFRTDEPRLGTVVEIQCPGSGWGEHSLLHDLYVNFPDSFGVPSSESLAEVFNRSLEEVFGAPPAIHHFMENASVLLSNLLHISYSRRAASAPCYWGYDKGVRALDCTLVRTHLFVSLLAENFTRPRLEMYRQGKLFYDLPPVCIFEQKLLLALPFQPSTQHYFSDGIRSILPFTSVIGPSGFFVAPEHHVTLDEFIKLPQSRRRFFIKYAGIDPSQNWGSRAVYYCGGGISRRQLQQLLLRAVADAQSGRGLWILQEAHPQEGSHEVIDASGQTIERSGYAKFSTLNSPIGFLGGFALFRPQRKVHGQPESAWGLFVREE